MRGGAFGFREQLSDIEKHFQCVIGNWIIFCFKGLISGEQFNYTQKLRIQRFSDRHGRYDLVWWLGADLGIMAAILHWLMSERPVKRLAAENHEFQLRKDEPK